MIVSQPKGQAGNMAHFVALLQVLCSALFVQFKKGNTLCSSVDGITHQIINTLPTKTQCVDGCFTTFQWMKPFSSKRDGRVFFLQGLTSPTWGKRILFSIGVQKQQIQSNCGRLRASWNPNSKPGFRTTSLWKQSLDLKNDTKLKLSNLSQFAW